LRVFSRVDDAFYREKQVQGWSRKKKEALIAGNPSLLPQLSECRDTTQGHRLELEQQLPKLQEDL
jgi:putative endonuclease